MRRSRSRRLGAKALGTRTRQNRLRNIIRYATLLPHFDRSLASMRLDRLNEYLTVVVTISVAIGLSLYLGMEGGKGSSAPFIVFGGIVAVMVALIMGGNIWILIPVFWSLTGQLAGLPGAFPVRDIVILYVFPIFLALKALKVVRGKVQYNWLDYLVLANLIYLAAAYLRHPSGTESMGIDRVGGKSYFETLIVFFGFWVISHVKLSPSLALKMPLLLILGSLFTGIIGAITFYFPSTNPIVGRFYTGVSMDSIDASTGEAKETDDLRQGYLGGLGYDILSLQYSRYSPLTTLDPRYFFRFAGSLFGFYAVLSSGFRSTFTGIAMVFAFSCYFRDGISSLFRSAFVCVPALALLIVLQGNVVELPFAVQRSLSFLPGNWSRDVTTDAEGSVDWRLEIWKKVWNSGDKYIHDWWFGDGYGTTLRDLREMKEMQLSGNNEVIQESHVLAGGYHSLPLSAIRTVGYVGLVLFCILYFGMSYYAWKLIRRAKGTPYFPMALMVGIPIIPQPLSLIFTGFYDSQSISAYYGVAILRLISRSLDDYLHVQKQANKPVEKLGMEHIPQDGLPNVPFLPTENRLS